MPKTISQQDAENIIKRITTKKILPPEVAANEGPRVNPPAELTPRGSPKLGRLVVLLLIVKLVVFAGVLAFVGYLARLGYLPRTRPIVPGESAVSD